MDQRNDGNRDANGGLAEATASRLRFDSDDDVAESEEVGMEVEEIPDAEGEEAADEVIGSDKTSADYYFDSYSHFGTVCSISKGIYFPLLIWVLLILACVGRNLILGVLWSEKRLYLLVLLYVLAISGY